VGVEGIAESDGRFRSVLEGVLRFVIDMGLVIVRFDPELEGIGESILVVDNLHYASSRNINAARKEKQTGWIIRFEPIDSLMAFGAPRTG
jgi:hypothetical protein